jgi:N-formylglutamate deformylase
LPTDLFTIIRPSEGVRSLPIVANLTHSGLKVPEAIAAQFTPEHLRKLPNSDWHLQPLYRFLPALGITVMQANYSRYVVDLNRALKPPFLGSFWSAVVPEQTAFNQPIYAGSKPSKAAIADRIDEFYTPYHQQLADLLSEVVGQQGKVYLLDLHSFMGLITDDVCLGNANGKTCEPTLIDEAADHFAQQGYQVVKNKVFTGGYITRHYGQQPCVQALQVEIRYPIYLPDYWPDDLPDNLPSDQLEPDRTLSDRPSGRLSGIPEWQGPKFEQAQRKLKKIFTAIALSLAQNCS